MSTIIRRLRWAAPRVALVLAAWFAILLALPFAGHGRLVAVLGGPDRATRAVIAAGGQVVDVKRGVVLARSDRPGFAAALYRQGVPLVVEGRVAAGCLAAVS